MRGLWVTGWILFVGLGLAWGAEEATITSDQLEILDNGQKTIFLGHVVLKRAPYTLHADRMVRTQPGGRVEAEGAVIGTWQTEKSKGAIQSDSAQYDPAKGITELWGQRPVTLQVTEMQGSAQFEGDRGWMSLEPKKARLIGRVRGHILPAKRS
jgi:lipopolysaccharide export system protein LptA